MLRYAEAPYAHRLRKKSVTLRYAGAQNAQVIFFPLYVSQRRHMPTSIFLKIVCWHQRCVVVLFTSTALSDIGFATSFATSFARVDVVLARCFCMRSLHCAATRFCFSVVKSILHFLLDAISAADLALLASFIFLFVLSPRPCSL